MRKKITLSVSEFATEPDKYLDAIYVDHKNVVIKQDNGRLFEIVSNSFPGRHTIEEIQRILASSIKDVGFKHYYTGEEMRLLIEINLLHRKHQEITKLIDSSELADMVKNFIHNLDESGIKPPCMFDDLKAVEDVIAKKISFMKEEDNQRKETDS